MKYPIHKLTIALLLSSLATAPIFAQSLVENSTATPTIAVPTKPGKQPKAAKAPARMEWPTSPKTISASVHDGVLTIDGFIAKSNMNYDIQGAPYLYFFLPGTGTVIVSLDPTPDSTFQKGAFHGSTLTFTADGHTFQLTSKSNMLKGSAFVHVDDTTPMIDRHPLVGYGVKTAAPYPWSDTRPTTTPNAAPTKPQTAAASPRHQSGTESLVASDR